MPSDPPADPPSSSAEPDDFAAPPQQRQSGLDPDVQEARALARTWDEQDKQAKQQERQRRSSSSKDTVAAVKTTTSRERQPFPHEKFGRTSAPPTAVVEDVVPQEEDEEDQHTNVGPSSSFSSGNARQIGATAAAAAVGHASSYDEEKQEEEDIVEPQEEHLIEASLVSAPGSVQQAVVVGDLATHVSSLDGVNSSQQPSIVDKCIPNTMSAKLLCFGVVLLLAVVAVVGIMCGSGLCTPDADDVPEAVTEAQSNNNNGNDTPSPSMPSFLMQSAAPTNTLILEDETPMPSMAVPLSGLSEFTEPSMVTTEPTSVEPQALDDGSDAPTVTPTATPLADTLSPSVSTKSPSETPSFATDPPSTIAPSALLLTPDPTVITGAPTAMPSPRVTTGPPTNVPTNQRPPTNSPATGPPTNPPTTGPPTNLPTTAIDASSCIADSACQNNDNVPSVMISSVSCLGENACSGNSGNELHVGAGACSAEGTAATTAWQSPQGMSGSCSLNTANVNVNDLGCSGIGACSYNTQGLDLSLRSCSGTYSCLENRASMVVWEDGCRGDGSCSQNNIHTDDEDRRMIVNVLDDGCEGEGACRWGQGNAQVSGCGGLESCQAWKVNYTNYLAPTRAGGIQFIVSKFSCTGNYSCQNLTADDGLTIGQNSCTGANSCRNITTFGNFTIGDGACTEDNSCQECTRSVPDGSNDCGGLAIAIATSSPSAAPTGVPTKQPTGAAITSETLAPQPTRFSPTETCPTPLATIACTAEFAPVRCGLNSCEYDNQCIAIAAGYYPALCYPSGCELPSASVACPLVSNPVICGFSNCEYSSLCVAEAAGFPSIFCNPVSCPQPSAGVSCSDELDSFVCVVDGIGLCRYNNGCYAAQAGLDPSDTGGQCFRTPSFDSNPTSCPIPSGTSCDFEYKPLRCLQGACLYANDCVASAAGLDLDDDCQSANCALPDANAICPLEFSPVYCYPEGCQYSNQCTATAAGYSVEACAPAICPSPDPADQCSRQYNAQTCETNGVSCFYDNTCLAASAVGPADCVEIATPENPSSCPQPPASIACTLEFDEKMCGDMDCRYSNTCLAEAAGFISSTDCRSPNCPAAGGTDEECGTEIDIVHCGPYSCPYPNRCWSRLAGWAPVECTPASCPSPPSGIACVLEYDPMICYSESQAGVPGCSYSNSCLAESAGYNPSFGECVRASLIEPSQDVSFELLGGESVCEQAPVTLSLDEIPGVTITHGLGLDENSGKTTFAATVVYEGQAWVGFAFSENGRMVGSTAVIGIPAEGISASNPGKYLLGGYSVPQVSLMEQQTLLSKTLEQNDTHTLLSFTKLLVEPDEVAINTNGDNFFLVAVGSGNDLAYHASRHSFTAGYECSR
ncbi:Eukaryotic cytochrome b561 [Seminavis robusta]|uniref:Eukaryotic cytochrome b561 n=1 Tax=Seminavis robusta TaxID=568900 RepID=A0A9N8H662_9STRA|nr:Eukaryotic cytochrome b561 [Seminavis robusta]|eukprot:Sro162_g072820.1 Eukaryotic cytochrome b561 (1367) ;mRNA; f:35838-40057